MDTDRVKPDTDCSQRRIQIPELHSAVYQDMITEYENINIYIAELEKEIEDLCDLLVDGSLKRVLCNRIIGII